jgi:hypothetical protein
MTAGQGHFGFKRRVAAAIKDFAGDDLADLRHI